MKRKGRCEWERTERRNACSTLDDQLGSKKRERVEIMLRFPVYVYVIRSIIVTRKTNKGYIWEATKNLNLELNN